MSSVVYKPEHVYFTVLHRRSQYGDSIPFSSSVLISPKDIKLIEMRGSFGSAPTKALKAYARKPKIQNLKKYADYPYGI